MLARLVELAQCSRLQGRGVVEVEARVLRVHDGAVEGGEGEDLVQEVRRSCGTVEGCLEYGSHVAVEGHVGRHVEHRVVEQRHVQGIEASWSDRGEAVFSQRC